MVGKLMKITTVLFSGIFLMGFLPAECQKTYTLDKLPAGINSEYEEMKPFFTSGGDSLFFIRSYFPGNKGGEHAGEDIWLSVNKTGSGWSEATNDFGYPNKPGPDILTALDCENHFMQVLDYRSPDKNDAVVIRTYPLPGNSGIKSGSVFEVPTGDDFHDLFLNNEKNVLLISMHSMNSIGMEDLYVSLKSETEEWSPPENMGPVINTRGFEISPFLSLGGDTLYFASNGHPGRGDADIFYSIRLGSAWDQWSEPVNMGSPFNSTGFDAGLSQGPDGDFVFVSNRDGGYADIFRVKELKEQVISVDQEMYLENNTAALTGRVFSVPDKRGNKNLRITLYFDFDEHKLEIEELDKLKFLLLEEYDGTALRIAGYTDESGSDKYNLKLSEKRARFVYRFLVDSGIEKERLYVEGMGIYELPDQKRIPASAKRRVEITGIPGSAWIE